MRFKNQDTIFSFKLSTELKRTLEEISIREQASSGECLRRMIAEKYAELFMNGL